MAVRKKETGLKIVERNYDGPIPFDLITIYQKDGDFKQMAEEALGPYPELLHLVAQPLERKPLCFVYNNLESDNIFLFITDEFTGDILVHESVHITFRIFDIIGAEPSIETEEFFAYITEFVYRELIGVCTEEFGLDMSTPTK
jgi:hypothetical protein